MGNGTKQVDLMHPAGGLVMISAEKLSKLQLVNSMLDEKYGEKGSASRAEFDAKAQAWCK